MHAGMPSFAMVLDTVVKSTVLLALAWSAALVLKKSSAATQHMVRTFALAALLLLPFSVMLLPAWHVKGIPEFSKPQTAPRQTATQPAAASPSPVRPAEASGPRPSGFFNSIGHLCVDCAGTTRARSEALGCSRPQRCALDAVSASARLRAHAPLRPPQQPSRHRTTNEPASSTLADNVPLCLSCLSS